MMAELEANAQSTSTIAQLARDDEPTGLEIQESKKRKLEALDYDERVERLEMRKAERYALQESTQSQRAERIKSSISTYQTLMTIYAGLCPDNQIDDHARVMFKDAFYNMASDGKAITNGEDKPITISNVAVELGLRLSSEDLQKAGIRIGKEYFKRYNAKPNKHEQKVGGAIRFVNSYTEKDKDLIVEVLKTFSD